MADTSEVPLCTSAGGLSPPKTERQSLKLCLSSKAKPGSWTVSPPKTKTESPNSEAGDVRWHQDHLSGNNDNPKQSGNLSGLETSPCQPQPCKLSISSRGCASPSRSSKNSDVGQVSTESEDDGGFYDQNEINAVITSMDHSGNSPVIKIGMSPRAGRFSPRSSGGFTPIMSGGMSPRISSRGLSPHATRFARVSESSPTSIKIVFLKNEIKDDLPEIPDGLKSPFKKPRASGSPRPLSSQTSNCSTPTREVPQNKDTKSDAIDNNRNERTPTNVLDEPQDKDCKSDQTTDRFNEIIPTDNVDEPHDKDTDNDAVANRLIERNETIPTEPLVRPFKISKNEIITVKRQERGILSRSESGDSDELPKLEKVIDVRRNKNGTRRTMGNESGDETFGDFDEMPDDLSRHSSVDRYSETNNTGTPVYDSQSMGSTSPPPLDRMSSGESEGPPPLAKMCCSGSQCHKSLGALGLQCLGSPKDTGVSPQYLECGGAREEAASIGEGSPPSDVEHANKGHDTPQFMLGNSSPPIPSPGDNEGCQKTQTVQETVQDTETSSPPQPAPQPDTGPKPKISFLGEFAKFVASTTGTVIEDEVTRSCKGNHSVGVNEHVEQCKATDELTADSECIDDKYNLRTKRKAGHYMCECCSHLPSPKKVKTVNSHRFGEQMQKVLHLRQRVCEMFRTVFPELQYPERFHADTSIVEDLMEQIIEAAKENEDCLSPKGGLSNASVNWDPQVVLCKSPRKCLLGLRHKICRMLLALLPTLRLEEDFDRGSRSVDRLLDDVIYLNTV